MKKAVTYSVAAVFTASAIVCFGLLGARQYTRMQIRSQINQLANEVTQPISTTTPSQDMSGVLPQYQPLYEKNTDFAAWIEIPDTKFAMPVMYTPQDSEYYLYRLFDRTDSSYGTPFIDARCALVPRSENLIVHGHNMKDNTMFSPLMRYEKQDYFLAHPVIQFDTIYAAGMYEIFAVTLEQLGAEDDAAISAAQFIDAPDDVAYAEYVQALKAQSLYDTGITPAQGDELLTLITCSFYGEDGRIAISARRIL